MAERLPIYEIERPLLAGLRETRRLIVSAPTGSGKSTQIPQMLLDHGVLGAGQVVILQPRRLATRLLAARVAWARKSDRTRPRATTRVGITLLGSHSSPCASNCSATCSPN